MNSSPIFYRITKELFENIVKSFEKAFISELENSDEYDFLRTNLEFQNMIKKYYE